MLVLNQQAVGQLAAARNHPRQLTGDGHFYLLKYGQRIKLNLKYILYIGIHFVNWNTLY